MDTKWYHVTTVFHGPIHTFNPHIPNYLRKGEDRVNQRICVTDNWRHSLRSIILIHRSDLFFVYVTTQQPINPTDWRKDLLDKKKIRPNYNHFRVLTDGHVNKEHWFLEPIEFKLVGQVEIPRKAYLGMLMGFGFCNEPDVYKLKLKLYKERKRHA